MCLYCRWIHRAASEIWLKVGRAQKLKEQVDSSVWPDMSTGRSPGEMMVYNPVISPRAI